MSIILSSSAVAEPFAGYDGLVTQVANFAHRSDLTAMMPTFLTLAESRISKDLRLAQQLSTATLTQLANVRGVDLPDDWLEIKSIIRPASPQHRLEFMALEQYERHTLEGYDQLSNQSISYVYSIDGFRLLTGRMSDTPYELTLRYYARLPSLLVTDNNWLIFNHPGVYLWAMLIEVMFYTQDAEKLMLYTQRYMAEIERLQSVENKAAFSGSTLRIRTR